LAHDNTTERTLTKTLIAQAKTCVLTYILIVSTNGTRHQN